MYYPGDDDAIAVTKFIGVDKIGGIAPGIVIKLHTGVEAMRHVYGFPGNISVYKR